MQIIKNKKGAEELQMHIIYIILLIIILAAMIYFVQDKAEGDAIKKQLIAKQTALILNSAEPGTVVTMQSDKFIIEKKDNNIAVRKEGEGELRDYVYEFYSPYNIDIETKKGITKIRISEK